MGFTGSMIECGEFIMAFDGMKMGFHGKIFEYFSTKTHFFFTKFEKFAPGYPFYFVRIKKLPEKNKVFSGSDRFTCCKNRFRKRNILLNLHCFRLHRS